MNLYFSGGGRLKCPNFLQQEKFYSAFSYFMEVLSLLWFSGGARTVWIRDRKAEKFTSTGFVSQNSPFCSFSALKYAEIFMLIMEHHSLLKKHCRGDMKVFITILFLIIPKWDQA